MKTLFISTADVVGGAARATYWLAKGLRANGTDVAMTVQRKTSDFSWVSKIANSKYEKYFDTLRTPLDTLPLSLYSNRTNAPWSLNITPNRKLLNTINNSNADIANLHWVGDGFLPISQLRNIRLPIVWSLYDMWPFTGGCHYDNNCKRYLDSCGKCPQLSSNGYDVSSFVHSHKQKHWDGVRMTVVAPSKWLAGEAKNSSLFRDQRIEVIPHGTDLTVFKPLNKDLAKDILNLDKTRRYVLFGAMAGPSDLRKGYQYLEPALKRLATLQGFENSSLLVFGANEPANPENLGFPIHYVGRLHDDVSLAVLYSAADVTVTPSTQEAFGMTASESMACGTPVVAFATAGPLDVIDHKIDGYLATPFEVEDLSNGIDWILNHKHPQQVRELAVQKCHDKFDLDSISLQYLNLYMDIINKGK
jgi:glycosyltransferase involved in cell wall biosynthesis